jgi:DNA-binding NtrC family response regulator
MDAKKILVVDDDPSVRELFGKALESPEYEVRGAADGVEALERVKDATFDLYLIDLMMPRMGGLDLLRALKEFDPGAIVFIITGFGSEDSARDARELGCSEYITKPFDFDEVKTLIRETLDARDRGLRADP